MGTEQAGRVVRCGVFAAGTTLLAAVAHAVSGTGLPDPRVLVAAGLGVGLAAHPLTRRERQLPAVLGATLAGQLVLHVVLTVSMFPACGPASGSVAVAVPSMTGMGSTSAAVGCSAGSWLPMTAPGRPGIVMLLGHLLGAVLLAGWLRRGERGLARLAVIVARALRPIRRRLAAACCPPPSRPPRPVVSGAPTVPVPHPGLRGAGGCARRGPPGLSRGLSRA